MCSACRKPSADLRSHYGTMGRFCPTCYERKFSQQQRCLWCGRKRPRWQYAMVDGTRSRVCQRCATKKVPR